MSALELALVVLPAVPLALTLLNLLSWQRGRAEVDRPRRVSLLIPARNEQRNLDDCLRASLASGYPLHEIIVYDDQSSDATPQILSAWQRRAPLLRAVRGGALPPGWVGKAHACHQLSLLASGEVLLFLDADCQLRAGGVERVLSLLYPRHGSGADVVSAVPQQRMESFGERLMLPLLHLTYTSWLPLFLIGKSQDPRLVAANGQLLALRAESSVLLGGFRAVASEIVDDVAFCRHAKARGARVVFADGTGMARCRMYRGFGELWRGFSKNLYEGLGARPTALALAIALYLGAFVLPYAALLLALTRAELAGLSGAAATGVALNLGLRGLLALRFQQPAWGVVLHPFSVLTLCALALNSYRWSARGRVTWAGRAYLPRAQRLARFQAPGTEAP